MSLDDRIVSWLTAHPGRPQSIAELAAAIPDTTRTSIERTCLLLRIQGVLGRNGAGTTTRPYRFYVKHKDD